MLSPFAHHLSGFPSPFGRDAALDPYAVYAVNGIVPEIVLDYSTGTYLPEGADPPTYTGGLGTFYNSAGVLSYNVKDGGDWVAVGNTLPGSPTYLPRTESHVWNGVDWGAARLRAESEARENLFLNNLVPATQIITLTAVAHTLQFEGAGTVTLTGASTAGPLVGTAGNDIVSLTFTPTAGAVTFALSGDVRLPQVEIGRTPSSVIITSGVAGTRPAETFIYPWKKLGMGGVTVAELASIAADVAFWDTTGWRDDVGGIGAELWTSFTTLGSGWTDNADNTYTSDGVAGFSAITQSQPYVEGNAYLIEVAASTSSGYFNVWIGNGSNEIIGVRTQILLIAGAGNTLSIGSNNAAGTVEIISVKEVDESWYWEELNTATRGATRPPPANALVVAEANRVVIYDMDTPDYLMWMIFTNDPHNMQRGNSGISSVDVLNAEYITGDNANYAGSSVNFILDATNPDTDLRNAVYLGNIAQRNDGLGSTLGTAPVVSQNVNDIAITLLSGDTEPTIACATDGNATYLVSVIQDDGTVYDVADGSTGTAVSVDISSDEELIVVRSDGAVYIWDSVGAIVATGTAPDTILTNLLGTVSTVEAA